MTKNLIPFTLHQTTTQYGCFTFQGYLRNQSLHEIARRLGFRTARFAEGAYIARATIIPHKDSFDLGGITKDSTDKFENYSRKEKVLWYVEQDQIKKKVLGHKSTRTYHEEKFKRLYPGINIKAIKKSYHDIFALSGTNALVKVIPKIPHTEGEKYPEGTMVPQFIMRGIPCKIIAEVKGLNGIFR